MTLSLGAKPVDMTLRLTGGADFIQAIRTGTGDDWPDTAVISIVIDGTTIWTATLDANYARWNVDKAAVATVIDTDPSRFRLICVDGTADFVWGRGQVSVTNA